MTTLSRQDANQRARDMMHDALAPPLVVADLHTLRRPPRLPFFRWLWAMDTRPAELGLCGMLMLRGAAIAAPGDDMTAPAYAWYLTVASETFWGWATIFFGLLVCAGILINGRWRRSPYLRMAGMIGYGVVYAMLTVSWATTGDHLFNLASAQFGWVTFGALWCAVNVASRA